MVKLLEADDYIIVNVLLLFLLINFNLEIGTIYGLMAMIDWVAYYIGFDKQAFKLIPVEKEKRNRWINLIWSMGAYVAFIFLANIIATNFSLVQGGSALENVSQLISQTFSATPILFGSKYLKLVVWGILIPIIESRFFFRTLFQWSIKASGFSFPTEVFSLKTFGFATFFGALFSVFHIVAKGITNNAALTTTFVFGFFSILLIVYFRELTQAIFLHIITNTIATMQQLGLGFFETGVGINWAAGIPILLGIILVSWLLLFQQIPLVSKRGIAA